MTAATGAIASGGIATARGLGGRAADLARRVRRTAARVTHAAVAPRAAGVRVRAAGGVAAVALRDIGQVVLVEAGLLRHAQDSIGIDHCVAD